MSFRVSLLVVSAAVCLAASSNAPAPAQDAAPLPGQPDATAPAITEPTLPAPADSVPTDSAPIEPPPLTAPEMPERPPIPAPPAVTLPPPANSTFAKPPLAWRSKAYKLTAGDSARPGVLRLQHSYDSGLRDTLNAIVTACNQCGFSLTAANFAAGHLFATDTKKSQLIFAAKQLPDPSGRRTVVKVAVTPDKDKDLAQSVDAVLSRAESILSSNGLL